MTDEQNAAVVEYVKYLLGRLELADWRFTISHLPPDDEDAYAMVLPVEGRRLAQIRLCTDFFTLDVDHIRHVLVHEVLHLAHQEQTDIIRCGLPDLLGQPAYMAIYEPFRLATERLVDQLAYAFEDYLSDWPHERELVHAIRGEVPPTPPPFEVTG